MKRTALILAMVLGGIALSALNAADPPRDPWNGKGDASDSRDKKRQEFVFERDGDTLLLLDTRTGCVWSRHKGSFETYWSFEFPKGSEKACADRLSDARAKAKVGD